MPFSKHGFLLFFASCAALWNYIIAASGNVGFVSAGSSLYNVSFDTGIIRKLPVDGLEFPAGIDCDPIEGKIYWAEYWGNKIGRCDLDGGNIERSFISDLIQPFGLALDVTNRWLYWIEEAYITDCKISRARLDGSDKTVILDIPFTSPKHIALDTVNNKIYWTDQLAMTIRRANVDGTNIETLVDNNVMTVNGITLDIQAGILFWCDWGTDTIESYNLATNQRSILYQSATDIEPYALALNGPTIYWVDGQRQGLWTILKDGSSQSPQAYGSGDDSFNGANGLKIITDVCSSLGSICVNGGQCLNQPMGSDLFTCQCSGDFEGRLCETAVAGMNCPTPNVPNDGFISSSDFGVGSTVLFICATGYVLKGVSQATCLESLTWSATSPICALECPAIAPPVNGALNPPSGPYSSGDQITFSCNPSYRLVGLTTILCMDTGSWSSSEDTTCALIVSSCSTPVSPINGIVVPSQPSYELSQTISFQCDTGYQLVGSASATCQSEGTWSTPTPLCQAVNCLAPPSPDFGNLQPDQSTYASGTQVNFVCNTGYEINGQMYAVCLSGGVWSYSTPMCQEILCAAPPQPQNGYLSPALSSYASEQQVVYKCNAGYYNAGDESATCISVNTWSNTSPVCQGITCAAPIPPSNGNLSPALSVYTYEQQVSIRCSNGYQLSGDDSVTCVSQNTWSGAVSSCQAITCEAPPQPQNGFISSALTSYAFGQQVTFECNNGYQLDGDATANCISQSTWSNPIPDCQAITCDAPAQPQNGFILSALTSYAFGQQVTFQCSDDFQLVGEASANCISQNTWSNPVPTCQVIQCAAPTQPQNGNISPALSSYAFEQQVTFRCNTGYAVVGNEDTLTCVGQNAWSSSAPTCQAITCTAPNSPVNGDISPTIASYFFGQRVSFRCNSGYEIISGASSTVCIDLDTWSNTAPMCQEIVTCSGPVLPLNGYILPDLAAYQIGEVVSFQCNTGYRLTGSATVTCLQNGAWSTPSPSCQAITCSQPNAPSNGNISPVGSSYSIGEQVEFQCNNNFQLDGPNMIYCLPDGSWSSGTPACQEITCSPPTQPTNGNVVPFMAVNPIATTLTFSCNPGYQISGSATVACTSDGSWSSPFPRCVEEPPMFCITPRVPINGNISPSVVLYPIGQGIKFSCYDGYDLEGSATLECTTDGSWSAVFPTCVQHVTCPMPSIPPNGAISPFTGPYDKGQQIVFSCNMGFQLRGVPAIVCQSDGTWTDTPPTCSQENCLQLNIPTNGYVVPQGPIPTGSGVTFVCDSGYEIQGSNVAVCLDSLQWSAPSPSCVEITCSPPTQLVNGQITPSQMSYSKDQIVTFTCSDGFQLIGGAYATCTVTNGRSEWSSSTPFCFKEAVPCPSLAIPLNGKLSPSQMSYLNGQRLNFECNTGYSLQGASQIICTLDGTWSGNSPTCVLSELTCLPLPNVQNGMMVPGGPYNVGAMVTYSCNSGYQLLGLETIVCTNDGTWSVAIANGPICIETDPMCQSPEASDNLIVLPPATLYAIGKVITFACANGYDIIGETNAVCTIQKTWSVAIPTCVKSVCVIERPANSILKDYDDTTSEIPVGSSLIFDCTDGYALSGVNKITCTKDRTWSDKEPSCDKTGAGNASLFDDPTVRLIMYAAIPSAFILLLILLIVCIVGCRRRRRRNRALSNEHLIMAYRKQNRTLPSAQGTDIYNIYGGADNRPMGSQSPIRNRNTHAQHQNSLPRSDHYQESLPRSASNQHSLPRSDNSHYQESLPRSRGNQQSLPRSAGQQNSLDRTATNRNSLERSGVPQNSIERSTVYQNSAPRVGGLPRGLPAAESTYANMEGASSPGPTPRDSRYRSNNNGEVVQLTRV